MQTTNQKIAALRAAANAAGCRAVYLVCSDPHSGEMLCDHWQFIRWLTGFTGDSCTLALAGDECALWTDGRYYVQADGQLAGSGVVSMHQGSAGVPEPAAWLRERLHKGERVAVQADCLTAARAQALELTLSSAGAQLVPAELIDPLWADRPPLPHTECWLLEKQYAGFTPEQKLHQLRAALTAAGATALALSDLPGIAWLLNLRAADVENTPVANAFCMVTPGSCALFIDQSRVPDPVAQTLRQNGVSLYPYTGLADWVSAYQNAETVLVDASCTNWALYNTLNCSAAFTLLPGQNPVTALKGTKNAVELACLRECHLRDGVAMVRFAMELERRLADDTALDELDIAPLLRRLRSEQDLFLDESFATIAAYGPNAAMMHYQATPAQHSPILRRGFLLVDCGGQYRDGTTDITRTYTVGPLTEQEKDFYTWTLQSHIAMARAVWLDYCTGFALDTLAREPLWRHGINYRCGTGHGVGFVGSVHEGPQALRPRNDTVFRAGMTITDEPGVYEAGLVGIRLENELECVDRGTNPYGHWLGFEPLTWVPFDLAGLKPELMSRDELTWLNDYHKRVYEKLSPRLTEVECRWLALHTAPIG